MTSTERIRTIIAISKELRALSREQRAREKAGFPAADELQQVASLLKKLENDCHAA